MKKKLSAIVAAVLALMLLLGLLGACAAPEQDLSDMYVVTYDLGGGTLNYGVNSSDTFNIAYAPNSIATDISSYRSWTLTRKGYDFEGWYKDPDFEVAWDFKNDRVTEPMTLYAKWKDQVVYYYELFLVVDGAEPESVYTYTVEQGEAFSDRSGRVNDLLTDRNRTLIGYYSDVELSAPWDDSFTHPGGENGATIPVYIKSIDGVWTFVDSYSTLMTAIANGGNIMLTADIDCRVDGAAQELYFGDFGDILEGRDYNGVQHTISNFVIPQNTEGFIWTYSLFNTLTEGAEIRNVTFTNAQVTLTASLATTGVRCAALALSVYSDRSGNFAHVTISNVTVSGVYTNLIDAADLPEWDITNEQLKELFEQSFGKAIFDDSYDSNVNVSGFQADFTTNA